MLSLHALLLACLFSALSEAYPGDGKDLCVLFCYATRNKTEEGFHIGLIDFQAQKITSILDLPLTLTGAGGGVAAGADDGQFFIPNADIAYNYLLEVSLLKNTTTDRSVAPPPPFAGIPAFYVMNLNAATDDLVVIFEESTRLSWVAAATVLPAQGTSTALTPDFAAQWLNDFQWRKVGVSAVDSKRGLLYFVAGAKSNDAATLVGIPMGSPKAPVVFHTLASIPGTDIDDLAYSAPLDEFVGSAFNMSTGIGSIWRTPASGAGGKEWVQVYSWAVGKESSMELGNGVLSKDGFTFFAAFTDPAMRPSYFAFDLKTNRLVSTFVVPINEYQGMLTAEVLAC